MNKIALCWLMICFVIWPEDSFAYRPFDSTDAAVADAGQLEIEFGPAGFRRSDAERTVIAPAYVFNYGFALTREHHPDLFVGTIIEGPYDWTIRPVAEVVYEREFNVKERFSVLGGA